jgi:hypothetical protein
MFTIVFISAKLLDSITLRVLRSSPLGPHASAHTQRSRRERCTRVTPRHPVRRAGEPGQVVGRTSARHARTASPARPSAAARIVSEQQDPGQPAMQLRQALGYLQPPY